VQYLDNKTNEIKPTRKFYRFNVMNPMILRSICSDVGDKYYVQCLVTNITKSMLYIEEVNLLYLKNTTPKRALQLS